MKAAIIEIIRQDMRLNQYLNALRQFGIEMRGLDIELLTTIALLMNLDNSKSDTWSTVYVDYLFRTMNYEREPMGRNLSTLAERCYEELLKYGVGG